MIEERGFDVAYGDYTRKKVLQRGTRLNIYMRNSSAIGPDFQAIYDSVRGLMITCIDIQSDCKVDMGVAKVRVVVGKDDLDFSYEKEKKYFQFGHVDQTKPRSISELAPKRQVVTQTALSDEWNKILGSDYTSKGNKKGQRLSKKERRRLKEAEKARNKKEPVILKSFIE